jgi:uncharacterized protein
MTSGRETTIRRKLEEGRDLFNERRFFEAHEAWEEAWLVEEGPARLRLQGLIQIAAGFHKAGQGAPLGCARLLEAGLEKLAAAGPDPELEAFAEAVRASLVEARRWERGEAGGLAAFPAFRGVK